VQFDNQAVGAVICRYRKEKGMTQELLSGLAGIGRTHLSAIERGQRKPTLETFWRISEALGLKPSVLMAAIEEEMQKN
jgi:transcriptional regulator with XRE-family HTH domain